MEFKLTIGVTPELQEALTQIANSLSLVPKATPAANGNGKAHVAPAATETKAAKTETKTEDKPAPAKTDTTSKELKITDLRALVNTKAQEDKREGIRSLLAEFGVEGVTKLKPEQYAEFYEKLKAL
jgi:hypothetical protein